MEVRCGQCSKLFRVADDKVTGAGIRFKCTRCGEYVTITRQNTQKEELPSDAGLALDAFAPKPLKSPLADPTPTPPSTPAPVPASSEPEADEGFPSGTDEEYSLQDDFPADDALFSDPALQKVMQEEPEAGAAATDEAFFAEPSLGGGLDEPLSGESAGVPEEGQSSGEFSFAEPAAQDQTAGEPGGPLAGFDILDDHEAEEQAFTGQGTESQEPPSFLASPYEFTEEAIAGAASVPAPEPSPAAAEPLKKVEEQKPIAAAPKPAPKPLGEQQQKPAAPTPTLQPAARSVATPDAKPGPEPKPAQPSVKAPERPASAPRPVQPPLSPSQLSTLDGVHPLASGSLAGTVGGIGCAVPALLMTFLGIGLLSMIAGEQKSSLSPGQALMMTAVSLMGLAILIGITLALFQAKGGRNFFGFGGVLLGGLISALIGGGIGLIVAAGSGAIVSTALIVSAGMGWGIKGLLVSAAVVLARRMVMSNRTETSSAEISGGQLFGIGLALLVMVLGAVGEIRSASNLRTAKEEATQALQNLSEGLQITSSLASWDPSNGDLLLNVTVENTTDEEKRAWYLVAKVYDAAGSVLTSVKMLSGKQLYGQKDFEVMTRRGVNVQAFRMERMQQKEVSVPARGVISVELRVIEPPAGVSSFVAAFEPFDPLKMIREEMEEAVTQKEGHVQQQTP